LLLFSLLFSLLVLVLLWIFGMNDTRKRANQSNYSNLDSPDGDINFIDIHIQVQVIYSTNSMISHV